MINTKSRSHSKWEIEFGYNLTRKKYRIMVRRSRLCSMDLLRYWTRWEITHVNVLNLHIIDLDRKYYTHLQREIEKEEEGEKEWKNFH
jgi:hypothetical protein